MTLGPVAQRQSAGLIIPWLQVRILPGPMTCGDIVSPSLAYPSTRRADFARPDRRGEGPGWTMDLQSFVTETLKQIAAGVRQAQKDQGEGATGSSQNVDFDVAVTTSEGSDKKGGAGVFVAGVGIGAQGSSSAASSTVSRIKFT